MLPAPLCWGAWSPVQRQQLRLREASVTCPVQGLRIRTVHTHSEGMFCLQILLRFSNTVSFRTTQLVKMQIPGPWPRDAALVHVRRGPGISFLVFIVYEHPR